MESVKPRILRIFEPNFRRRFVLDIFPFESILRSDKIPSFLLYPENKLQLVVLEMLEKLNPNESKILFLQLPHEIRIVSV